MNLQILFTSSRVLTALYRTVSTTVLLYYFAKRLSNRQPPRYRPRHRHLEGPYD